MVTGGASQTGTFASGTGTVGAGSWLSVAEASGDGCGDKERGAVEGDVAPG